MVKQIVIVLLICLCLVHFVSLSTSSHDFIFFLMQNLEGEGVERRQRSRSTNYAKTLVVMRCIRVGGYKLQALLQFSLPSHWLNPVGPYSILCLPLLNGGRRWEYDLQHRLEIGKQHEG
jgi:hypothetical protein